MRLGQETRGQAFEAGADLAAVSARSSEVVLVVVLAAGFAGAAGCSSDPAEFLKIEGVTSDGGALEISVTYKCPAGTPGDHRLDAKVGEEISVVANVNATTVASEGWQSDEPGVPDVPAMDEIKPLSGDGRSVTVEAAG